VTFVTEATVDVPRVGIKGALARMIRHAVDMAAQGGVVRVAKIVLRLHAFLLKLRITPEGIRELDRFAAVDRVINVDSGR
jgi:hypothetical protein